MALYSTLVLEWEMVFCLQELHEMRLCQGINNNCWLSDDHLGNQLSLHQKRLEDDMWSFNEATVKDSQFVLINAKCVLQHSNEELLGDA